MAAVDSHPTKQIPCTMPGVEQTSPPYFTRKLLSQSCWEHKVIIHTVFLLHVMLFCLQHVGQCVLHTDSFCVCPHALQVRFATRPTPSSLTCAATNACMLTAAHRSSARTVGRCSAPRLPSTSIGVSVKAKIISQQGGCLLRVCHFLVPLGWTNQLWQWAIAVLDWPITLGPLATVGLLSLQPQHSLSASLASSLLDCTTGHHSFLQPLQSDSQPMHLGTIQS